MQTAEGLNRRRAVARIAIPLAVGLATLAISASSASALTFSRQLTGYGEPTVTPFTKPVGLVANASGDVYVADEEGKVIDEFGPKGEDEAQINGAETPTGEAEFEPRSVALDAGGDLYAIEFVVKVVDKFGPEGKWETSITTGPGGEGLGTLQYVAVDNSTESPTEDPSKGDVYVVDSSHKVVDKFSAAGVYESQLKEWTNASTEPEEFKGPKGVAVAPNGDVYVADSSAKVVDEFSPAGVFIGQLTGATIPASAPVPGPFEAPVALALDAAGNVYVTDNGAKVVDEFTSAGVYLTQLTGAPAGAPVPGPFGEPKGVAVDAEGNVYVADAASKVVDVFEVHLPPVALLGAVSANDTGLSATLNGEVNPNEAQLSSCEFEYGTSAPTEHKAACTPGLAAIGEGNAPVKVSAGIAGLTPNTSYQYQLRALGPHGTSVAEGGLFTSASVQPVIEPAFASGVTQFRAVLNGAFEPRNAPVGYHFVYVEAAHYHPGAGECPAAIACAYAEGAVMPEPDLDVPAGATLETLDTAVPQEIAGLHPGTTYDFALVATGPGGTQVSPNATFTTPGIPLPAASTGGVAGVSEAAATLTGAVNPEGWETTYNFQYGTTPYGACALGGQSWPTVPIVLGGLNGSQGVSVFVERLQPNTTYFYRTVASNAEGTVCGGVQSFRTSEYPASIIQETPLLGGLPGTTKTKTTTKPETNAQKLAAALKSCKKEAKKKQAKCKAQAKKKYAPKKTKSKKKK